MVRLDGFQLNLLMFNCSKFVQRLLLENLELGQFCADFTASKSFAPLKAETEKHNEAPIKRLVRSSFQFLKDSKSFYIIYYRYLQYRSFRIDNLACRFAFFRRILRTNGVIVLPDGFRVSE